MINETRERFLKAIVERIPAERIVEVHFFPGLRQGHVESGVAVIAALHEPAAPTAVDATDAPAPEPIDVDVDGPEAELEAAEADASDDPAAVTEAPESGDGADAEVAVAVVDAPAAAMARTEVFTATYRFTRKGPDRGKWIVDVVAEADAPLATVATVVKGVEERSGEGFETDRMNGDEVRAALAAGAMPPLPTSEATAA